ncbi:hypothetical protein FRC19_010350 [Serendipita sp. 401]|nr:hypothetical protein FRC19_010350 [Serendipita sp. 401]KAG9052243.1 hypothetical protein FS842_010251 [Serendipita sp. 407]
MILSRKEGRRSKYIQIENSIQEKRQQKQMEVKELEDAAQQRTATLQQRIDTLLEETQRLKDTLSEEIRRVKETLAEDKSKVAAKYDTIIQELDDQLQGLQRLNNQDDHLISLVNSIPDEILSLIFETYVLDGESPRLLQAVSHRWRSVSLSTPRLWARIGIYSRREYQRYNKADKPLMSRRYWGGSFEPCFTAEHVEKTARMAGSLDLSVVISSIGVEADLGSHHPPRILRVILGPQYSSRIVNLHIDSSSFKPIWWKASNDWIGNFAKLQSLHSNSGSESERSLDSLIAARSTIRNLTFCGNGHTVFLDTTLSGIRSLEIDYLMDEEDFNEILPKLLQIEYIKRAPWLWPSQNTPSLILPTLKEIKLTCDGAWLHLLTMPKLKMLYISQEKSRRGDTPNDTQARRKSIKGPIFPNLEYLDVEANSPSFLSNYQLPSLRRFRLSSQTSRFHKRHKLLPFKCPNTLSEFILCGGCSIDVIRDALRKVPKLQVFKLQEYNGDDQASLLGVFAVTANSHVICPELKEIEFEFCSNWDYEQAQKDPSPFRRVMEEQQSVGSPLVSFKLFSFGGCLNIRTQI